MIKQLTATAIIVLGLAAGPAQAAGSGGEVNDVQFSFEGLFGTYDKEQLRRGLKVYTEVCSACHGLRYVPLRTLADPGGPEYTEDEVRAYAANNFTIYDPELEDDRPRRPADFFPTVSGEGMGPDLSLMAKARAGFHGPAGTGINQLVKGIGGAEYIAAFLTGFNGKEQEVAGQYLNGNDVFPGGWTAMPPQLEDGSVEFDDGYNNSAKQLSKDVAAFLMWAAEPKMHDRKQVGFIAVLMLVLLTSLLYLTNKKLWAPHKGKKFDA
ncbi:ubiquinol-cytochrome c reductase cytochrome c1 subunit [Aliiroseovarius crassostreae]|uniref:Cytochrome c1 n=1 Tax=Aliiroseovarius crassostreae TaxID=154981 RepID=A0A0P7I655_9RHOB|nr:cytochrome c1 [Aliiroseovarius crassostreae]KPN64784.1 cytochrome C [Aliiroseovarius crassostreae]SFU78310.1 ubiquinol-cytochrome c reductase cytochrome c1 subunit [Aliiroseovarius crassostreae]